jgi:hypothetical protein
MVCPRYQAFIAAKLRGRQAMKRWFAALALCGAGCTQQDPAALITGAPGSIELSAPEPLQKEPVSAVGLGWPAPGQMVPRRPTTATASLTLVPPGLNAVSQVRQVVVTFEVKDAQGAGQAAAEFVAPSGAPYHRDEAAIGLVPGQVDQLSFELPVAATAIDTNKLTGRWTVRLLVDGKALATQDFELTQ